MTLIISIALLFFVLYVVLCYLIADRFGPMFLSGLYLLFKRY